ncbi:MAG: hypothetical protein HQ568_09865 [Calditrichaeota bacterium]|nr:hypothetical protein [Calditrichota bacterium]
MVWFVPIIKLLVGAAMFWFAYVFITQDHNQNWKLMILWIFIGRILSLPARLLTEMSNTTTYSMVSEILGLAIMYAFLYFILSYKYSVNTIVKKIKIMAMHLVVMHLFGWIVGLAFGK